MLARQLAAAFFALGTLGACASLVRTPSLAPVPAEVLERSFAPEEIAADVEHLFAMLEEVHPDPYCAVSRESIGERRAALIAGLDRPLTRRELQPRLAELVAALGDGHTSVYLPEEFWRDPGGAGSCFPIDVVWDGSALRVRRTAVMTPDGALGPGARLLEISGRTAEDLVQTFLARHSGESEAFRVAGVEVNFPQHLWVEGIKPPFRVRVASALDQSNVFEMDLSGMHWSSVARGEAPPSGVGTAGAAACRRLTASGTRVAKPDSRASSIHIRPAVISGRASGRYRFAPCCCSNRTRAPSARRACPGTASSDRREITSRAVSGGIPQAIR